MAGHTASPTVRKPMNPGAQLTFSRSVKPLHPLSPLASPDSGFSNKNLVEIENTHNIKTLSNCIIPSFLAYSQNYAAIATISEHRGETAERLMAPTSLSESWGSDHSKRLTTPVTPASRDPAPLSSLYEHPCAKGKLKEETTHFISHPSFCFPALTFKLVLGPFWLA